MENEPMLSPSLLATETLSNTAVSTTFIQNFSLKKLSILLPQLTWESSASLLHPFDARLAVAKSLKSNNFSNSNKEISSENILVKSYFPSSSSREGVEYL